MQYSCPVDQILYHRLKFVNRLTTRIAHQLLDVRLQVLTQSQVFPDNSSVSNLLLTHLSIRFFLGPFQPGMLFHKQLLRRTRLIYSTFKRYMSRHLQFWPSASCTMHIVCTCSTAHSFLSGFNLYAPVFAVADHRGQDPASSVLSFEGRCYLLIQIQIQIPRFRIRCWHKLQKFQIDSYKNLFYAFWN